jgi:hypothetical protein
MREVSGVTICEKKLVKSIYIITWYVFTIYGGFLSLKNINDI